MHFIKMDFFKHFIPDFFNKKLVNYGVGIIEFTLGLGLFFPKTVNEASIGIFILLILLLPIHIWDLTKQRPAIGSKKIAIVRIPFQFVLMYGIYYVYIHP
jgi:uncharacterized membrane protein